jgi:hypothetical protein
MVRNKERVRAGDMYMVWLKKLLVNEYAILIVMEMMQKGNIDKLSFPIPLKRKRFLEYA